MWDISYPPLVRLPSAAWAAWAGDEVDEYLRMFPTCESPRRRLSWSDLHGEISPWTGTASA
jgi:hypothetical protein